MIAKEEVEWGGDERRFEAFGSMHGRDNQNITGRIKKNENIFHKKKANDKDDLVMSK